MTWNSTIHAGKDSSSQAGTAGAGGSSSKLVHEPQGRCIALRQPWMPQLSFPVLRGPSTPVSTSCTEVEWPTKGLGSGANHVWKASQPDEAT